MDNTEKKAKELLSSLQVTCPDTVWHDLSFDLEQEYGNSDARWKNKMSGPGILVVALLIVTVSSLLLWKYLSGKQNTITPNQPVIIAQASTPPPQPIQKSSPPPVIKDSTASIKKDSLPATQAPNTEITNKPIIQPGTNSLFASDKQHQVRPSFQKLGLATKKDSAFTGNIRHNRSDSSAVKPVPVSSEVSNNTPRAMVRDSVPIRTRDTIN